MSIKQVMIIDDEPTARRHLRSVIDGFDQLEIIGEVGDGKTAIAEIKKYRPDIVFLDVEMPEVNGFDVASATADVNYQLVFVTAYDQYALDAFDTNAIDYLLKPVRPSLLEKCVNKILRHEERVLEGLKKQKTQSDSIALSDGNRLRIVKQSHITYIEGIGRYRRIHLAENGRALHEIETILSDTTLDEFESQMSSDEFVRLHRSYLVNLHHILNILVESRRHFVTLRESGMKIPVSRANVSSLKQTLGEA